MKAKKKYADRFVGRTPDNIKGLEDRQKKVLEIFSHYEFERILDIGCGDGNFSVLLKEACKAKEVYGIEISEKEVEIARKNGVKCYQLDVDEEDFPFEDNYFDAVTALELIEHLFDPDHFLDEVYRVLKPEGIFVLSTPNLASIHNRIALLFGYQPFSMNPSHRYRVGHITEIFNLHKSNPDEGVKREADHIHPFTLKALKMLLHRYNFKIVKVYGAKVEINILKSKFAKIFEVFETIVSKNPSFSLQVIVMAKKG